MYHLKALLKSGEVSTPALYQKLESLPSEKDQFVWGGGIVARLNKKKKKKKGVEE